jgi:hypothetical protein
MKNPNDARDWTKAFCWALGAILTWHLLLTPLIWFPSLKGAPTNATDIANWALEQTFKTSYRVSEAASIAWLLFPRHATPRISLTWSALLFTGASITAHALNSDSLSEFQDALTYKVASLRNKKAPTIQTETTRPPNPTDPTTK